MDKLSWEYNDRSSEETTLYCGLRIRAVHDEDARNPLEEWDGHWPMLVRTDDRLALAATVYADDYDGVSVHTPQYRFTAAQLVMDQHAILAAVGTSTRERMTEDGADEPRTFVNDSDQVLGWLDQAIEYEVEQSKQLETLETLYDLLKIPCLRTTVTGYCQGDWAELLIVATPEALEKNRQRPDDMTDEQWRETLEKDMQSQADLYEAWAFGDVYGYIVEESVRSPDDDDDDEPEWVEIDDGSCWGYYGSDHHDSGLEEAAREVADAHLARRKREREERLKTLLRNRVPLANRAKILEAA